MNTKTENLSGHQVVTQDEWIRASSEFLAKEKEFTKLRDDISRQRRELPWVRVEKDYSFEDSDGRVTLSELFGDKSQLIVYHFMFGPGWTDGCTGCSFVSDHFDGMLQHLKAKDVAFVAVSRAPLNEFQAFKKRMGWNFPWLSSAGSDFNYDFGVSFRQEDLDQGPVMYNFKVQPIRNDEQPGLTVFYKDQDGAIYRTYSTYERGLDLLIGTYNFLDLLPKGREEEGPMDWVLHHDKY